MISNNLYKFKISCKYTTISNDLQFYIKDDAVYDYF